MTVFLYDKSGIVVPKFVTDLIEVSYFGRNLNTGDGSKSKIRLKKNTILSTYQEHRSCACNSRQ